ncbi:MAG: response regulator [Bacteroidota bacterium]|nr:response regulator [Ferruginibacter sp.]
MIFLLVDDDQEDTQLFEEILNEVDPRIGFEAAQNGKVALQKLRNREAALPNLIFLDLNMPLMNGKECLAELKQDPALKNIPVIIYTTSAHSRDIEETLMAGALCFITKPMGLKDLRCVLSSIASSLPNQLENGLKHLNDTCGAFVVY